MEILTTQSKIDQVHTRLRHMIKKNNYKAGSKLAGTRILAKKFNVSPKTVKSALDILQKERLIRCEHGRGIFIEPHSKIGEIEVYILLWGMRRESCNFYEEITKIAYPPVLKPNFSFTLRTVFKDTEDINNFDQELARIENSPQISCIFTSAVQFNIEHFKKLESLHCPVVYFADSKYEEVADYPRNRIIDSSDRLSACLDVLHKNGEKELTFFIPDGSISFFKDQTQRMVMLSSQAGIKLNLFEVPALLYAEFDHTKIYEVYSRYIKKAADSGLLDCPILILGMINSIFMEIPEVKQRLNSNVPLFEVQLNSFFMSDFYEATFSLIREVVATPEDIITKTVNSPVLIYDYANKEKHLIENNIITKE